MHTSHALSQARSVCTAQDTVCYDGGVRHNAICVYSVSNAVPALTYVLLPDSTSYRCNARFVFAGTYCAAKSACRSVSEALRMELAPFDVDVVLVTVGSFLSSLVANSNPGQLDTRCALLMVRRFEWHRDHAVFQISAMLVA